MRTTVRCSGRPHDASEAPAYSEALGMHCDPAVSLYVGGHSTSVAGLTLDHLTGKRCFTAAHRPPSRRGVDPGQISYLMDSGAFTDPPDHRLSPSEALERQLTWESRASDRWGCFLPAEAVVSYDLLIDEVWIGGQRHKRRWTVADADWAVAVTVEAAAYLASRRRELAPRALVLSCQGVDAVQYAECAAGVLVHAEQGDWIGLGGWCIVGRFQRWLPEFRRTVAAVLPMVATAGVQHVHVFGVLWEPALASLVWTADQHGLQVSTDSTAPLLAATRGSATKAGMRADTWLENVTWWRNHLAQIRQSQHYGPYSTEQQTQLFSEAI